MKYTVLEGGVSLLNFLKEEIRGAPSVKAIKRALEDRACLVNGRIERFGSRRLNKGDNIQFLDQWGDEGEDKPLIKLFEDEYLLAIDKPVGLVCEDRQVRGLMPEYGGKLWLVHRLDKETSGVLLLAKSVDMKDKIRGVFAARKMEKTYLALVHGNLLQERGTIDSILVVKGHFAGQTIYGSVAIGKGDRAITHWKVLEKRKAASLVECKPITGRTHQIRVHLSSLGHPILGDLQYGRRKNEIGVQRCLLHAHQLKFPHPITGDLMLIEASIPKEILGGASY